MISQTTTARSHERLLPPDFSEQLSAQLRPLLDDPDAVVKPFWLYLSIPLASTAAACTFATFITLV